MSVTARLSRLAYLLPRTDSEKLSGFLPKGKRLLFALMYNPQLFPCQVWNERDFGTDSERDFDYMCRFRREYDENPKFTDQVNAVLREISGIKYPEDLSSHDTAWTVCHRCVTEEAEKQRARDLANYLREHFLMQPARPEKYRIETFIVIDNTKRVREAISLLTSKESSLLAEYLEPCARAWLGLSILPDAL